jgi:hypothetical protein
MPDVIVGDSFVYPLLMGIWKKLNTDPLLRDLCPGGVHDGNVETSHGAAVKMPYIRISETDERMADRLTTTASDVFVHIEILSNYRGSKEVLMICNRIHFLLHRQERQLETPGWHTNMIVKHSQVVLTTGDNDRNGIMRFRVKGQPVG